MKSLARDTSTRWWATIALLAFAITPFWRGGRDGAGFIALPVALFIAWLLWSQVSRKYRAVAQYATLPWLLFSLWTATGLVWATDKHVASLRVLTVLSSVLIFMIVRQIADSAKWRERFVDLFILGSASPIIFGIYLYLTNVYDRAASVFYAPNAYALYLMIIWLAVLHRANTSDKKYWWVTAGVVASQFLLVQSLASMAIAVVVTGILMATMKTTRQRLMKLAAVIVIGFIVASGIVFLKENVSIGSIGTPDGATELVATKATGLGERFNYWQDAINIYGDNIVIGVGPDNFQTVYPQYQDNPGLVVENPHNFYLQTFAEGGAVGGMLLVASVLSLIFYWWNHRNSKNGRLYLTIIIAMLLHAGFYQTSRYPVFWFIFATFLALWLTSTSLLARTNATPRRSSTYVIMALILAVAGAFYYRTDSFAQEGLRLYRERRIADSTYYFERAVEGRMVPSHVYRSLAYQNTFGSEFTDALVYSNKAIESDGTGQSYAAKAFVLHQSGAPSAQVRENYEAAIRLDPFNSVDVYTNYVRYLFEQSDLQRAGELLDFILPYYDDETLQKREGLSDVRKRVGLLQFQAARLAAIDGDDDQLLKDLERTLELYPKYGTARSILDQLNEEKR